MCRLYKLVVFYCLGALGAIMLLAGCSDNIPSSSILESGKVTLSWDEVPGANSYNAYGATSPGVTKHKGIKFRNVSSPYTITKLQPGKTYYFVITAVRGSGESKESKEVSYTAIADAGGSVEFGNIVSPPKADSESKPIVDPKQQKGQNSSIRSKIGTIICFGDSLTFGTGASKGMDYPSQLAKMIGQAVINKGIPGDTTYTALRRLQRDVLSQDPDLVLITLGGNDLKNGIPKKIAFGNLKQIIQNIQKQGAQVIIGGLKFPGIDRGFGKGYEDLATHTGALLIPDIFAGIVENPSLMSDPIHPNNNGYRIIAKRFNNAIASIEVKEKPTIK